MSEFLYKLNNYNKLAGKQLRDLLITICAATFILTFRMWGPDNQVIVDYAVYHVAIGFVGIVIIVFVYEYLYRLMSARSGYSCNYSMWLEGIVVGLLLCFLSGGLIPYIHLGGHALQRTRYHAIGRFRNLHMRLDKIAFISVIPPVGLILLATIFKLIAMNTTIGMFDTNPFDVWTKFAVLIALYSMLPIEIFSLVAFVNKSKSMETPQSNGLHILLKSRIVFFTVTIFIALYGITVVNGILIAMIPALILGFGAGLFLNKIVDEGP